MNLALWMMAGCAAGWIGFSLMGFNARRGMTVSLVIGMLAACAGGWLIAPMLSASIVNPGDLNPLSLLTAFASAAGCLVIGDMIFKRFGV